MEVENARKLKGLNEQMTSNPDLTNVHLSVATANGMETVPLEFASADKRAVWENAFREAKNALCEWIFKNEKMFFSEFTAERAA